MRGGGGVSNHKEFPTMTPGARAAYKAAIGAIRSDEATFSPNDLRRALAAFQRRAMNQYRLSYGTPLWNELEAIAASLHNPPPPPPTLAEAREADLHTPEGRATVSDFLANLAAETQP